MTLSTVKLSRSVTLIRQAGGRVTVAVLAYNSHTCKPSKCYKVELVKREGAPQLRPAEANDATYH